MKYLQKFNESNSNYITESDFIKVEDLFLDYIDQGGVFLWRRPSTWPMPHDEFIFEESDILHVYIDLIQDGGPLVNIGYNPSFNTPMHAKKWAVVKQEDLDELQIDDRKPTLEKNFILSDPGHVDELLNGTFPDKWEGFNRAIKNNLLNFLHKNYDLGDNLKNILGKTKGLNHFGLNCGWGPKPSIFFKLELNHVKTPFDDQNLLPPGATIDKKHNLPRMSLEHCDLQVASVSCYTLLIITKKF